MTFRNVTTEVEEEYEVERDELVKRTIKEYHKAIDESLKGFHPEDKDNLFDILKPKLSSTWRVLTPHQINLTLIELIKESNYYKKEEINNIPRKIEDITEMFGMGYFITKLIQNSYNSGYNDFTLNTNSIKINNLNPTLRGTKKNPIKISINGLVDKDFADDSRYVICDIRGDITDPYDGLGVYTGFIQYSKCPQKRKSEILKNNLIKKRKSKHNIFIISGKWDGELYPLPYHEECTFKIKDQSTYETIKAIIPKLKEQNKYQLIDKKGKVLEEITSTNRKKKYWKVYLDLENIF